MESRIEAQQLDLFAGRTSTHTPRANQIRLYFASFAYVLVYAVRRVGLQDRELVHAQCGTLRLKLLQIGAEIRISVRRVVVAFSGGLSRCRTVPPLARIQAAPLNTGRPSASPS
jgi:hypothetical protein